MLRVEDAVRYAVYCSVILLWSVSAGHRIVGKPIRRKQKSIVFFLILLLFLGRLRHAVFAGVSPAEQVLRYLCLLPNLAVPLLSWSVTRYIREDGTGPLPAGARMLFIPYAVLAGVLYNVLYAFDRLPYLLGWIETDAVYCFLTVALWELCITMHLIPSNSGYKRWFRACTVPMEMLDRDGGVQYSSEGHRVYQTAPSRPDAKEARFYVTRTFPVPGGNIRWREDITRFQEVIGKLEENAALLEASNEKLAAQNRMQMQTAKARERAKLYDRALGENKDRLERMQALLDSCGETAGTETEEETLRQTLAVICVLGAYVKRRSNLVLLADKSDTLPLAELHFCLHESNEALVLIPVSTIYKNEADVTLRAPVSDMMHVYDAFEKELEAVLETLEYLRMTLRAEDESTVLSLWMGGEKMGEKEVRFFFYPERRAV